MKRTVAGVTVTSAARVPLRNTVGFTWKEVARGPGRVYWNTNRDGLIPLYLLKSRYTAEGRLTKEITLQHIVCTVSFVSRTSLKELPCPTDVSA